MRIKDGVRRGQLTPRDHWGIGEDSLDREPVSEKPGFKNPLLLLFMFLYLFQQRTYYPEERDTVIAADASGEQLRIWDIVPYDRISHFGLSFMFLYRLDKTSEGSIFLSFFHIRCLMEFRFLFKL